MANLDRFVNATITRTTRTVSRRSFGMILLAGFHTAWADRVREYSDPDAMVEDGLAESHPLVLAARALARQQPRVRSWKVGRRAGAPAQIVRLTPRAPEAAGGELFEVSLRGVRFSVTTAASATVADVCDALVLAINADPDAILATGASATTAQAFAAVDLDGVTGGVLSPARNATATFSTNAHWTGGTLELEGLDANGREQVEALAVPVGGGTVLGTKVWSQITGAALSAQGGTAGTFKIGVGQRFTEGVLDVTATDGTTHVDIAADTDGDWYAVGRTTNLAFEDRTAEPSITLASDLAAIRSADADWYGLVVVDASSKAQVLATAAWAESQTLIHAAFSMDTAAETTASDDVLSELRAREYLRTWTFWSRGNHAAFPHVSLLGVVSPLDVGSADYDFKQLVGVEADALDETVITRLTGTPSSPAVGKRATVYIEAIPTGTNAGTAITWGGLVAGGEWIDVVTGLDFWRALLQERALNFRLARPKVPFTAAGIDAFAGTVRSATKTVAAAPYNILDPDSLTYEATQLEDIDSADRQARRYDGVRVNARVQGAIRVLDVSATVGA